MLPDALVVCPVKALVLDTNGIFSPKTRFNATLSLASLLGVPVPCAFTYWISWKVKWAISMANLIEITAPSPSFDEAV